jgi:hypothetical protein
MSKLLQKLLCLVGNHNWTSATQEGIKPTRKQLADGVEGWVDYSKMYCKACGTVYEPSAPITKIRG